jgi:hypothetical protein
VTEFLDDWGRNGSAQPQEDEPPADDADWLDDAEYERLKTALDEMRREQKELMRRRMGLS